MKISSLVNVKQTPKSVRISLKTIAGFSTHTETVVGDHVKFIEHFESVFICEVSVITIPFGAVPISINIVIELFVTNACWSDVSVDPEKYN